MTTEDVIAERRSAAEARLMEAVGAGGSLCAIAKSGKSYPAVKYHEGEAAALMQAARLQSPDAAGVSDLAEVWRSAAEREADRGPDWAAYRAGGVEALDALLADLTG